MQEGVLVNESQKPALSEGVGRFHSGPSSKASMLNMKRTISSISCDWGRSNRFRSASRNAGNGPPPVCSRAPENSNARGKWPVPVPPVVGKWVWLDVSPTSKPNLAALLWCPGFHCNQRRGVWQHPCGPLLSFCYTCEHRFERAGKRQQEQGSARIKISTPLKTIDFIEKKHAFPPAGKGGGR